MEYNEMNSGFETGVESFSPVAFDPVGASIMRCDPTMYTHQFNEGLALAAAGCRDAAKNLGNESGFVTRLSQEGYSGILARAVEISRSASSWIKGLGNLLSKNILHWRPHSLNEIPRHLALGAGLAIAIMSATALTPMKADAYDVGGIFSAAESSSSVSVMELESGELMGIQGMSNFVKTNESGFFVPPPILTVEPEVRDVFPEYAEAFDSLMEKASETKDPDLFGLGVTLRAHELNSAEIIAYTPQDGYDAEEIENLMGKYEEVSQLMRHAFPSVFEGEMQSPEEYSDRLNELLKPMQERASFVYDIAEQGVGLYASVDEGMGRDAFERALDDLADLAEKTNDPSVTSILGILEESSVGEVPPADVLDDLMYTYPEVGTALFLAFGQDSPDGYQKDLSISADDILSKTDSMEMETASALLQR